MRCTASTQVSRDIRDLAVEVAPSPTVLSLREDVNGWTSVILPAASAIVGAASINVTENATNPDTVSVSIPKALASPAGKLFSRLRVTRP